MANSWERLFDLPTPFNMVILVVAIVVVGGLLSTIAIQIRKYASLKQELDFKREMIDRGMTVEEVERLVHTTSNAGPDEV